MKLRHEGELRVIHEDANKQQLDRIEGLIRLVLKQGDKIMASQAQFEQAMSRIDTATSAVAALLTKYVEDKKAGGMTAAEEDTALSRLSAAATALEQMAKEPENPVPVEPPSA